MSDNHKVKPQHKFNKFSQHDLENMCFKYKFEKDQNGKKYTKNLICKIFNISRPWFNIILDRYKTDSELIAKSRINVRYESEEYKTKRRQRLIDQEVKIAQKKAIQEQVNPPHLKRRGILALRDKHFFGSNFKQTYRLVFVD